MYELVWRKSSFSGGGNGDCVETAVGPGGRVCFREGDEPAVVASTGSGAWKAFVRAVQGGQLDG
ncbi:DUF397 domain-containing protein [Streptomyces sp. NPDC017056]|uniref:DUF397 domain-containing protein n=1 Tax=Streptomyces sp. NPDC017056 TaxID=3364973 RepID=UPI0037B76AB6